jgi:hypothetical protein
VSHRPLGSPNIHFSSHRRRPHISQQLFIVFRLSYAAPRVCPSSVPCARASLSLVSSPSPRRIRRSRSLFSCFESCARALPASRRASCSISLIQPSFKSFA